MRRNHGPAWTGMVARHAPESWPGMDWNPHPKSVSQGYGSLMKGGLGSAQALCQGNG